MKTIHLQDQHDKEIQSEISSCHDELQCPYDSFWQRAIQAMEMQNYYYAQQLLEPILKQFVEFLPARRLVRQAAIAQRRTKKTPWSLQKYLFILRVEFRLRSNPRSALDLIENVLKLDPYNYKANQYLKKAALTMGLVNTAAFALETILVAYPNNTKIMHELALLYASQMQFRDAENIYRRILTYNPNDLVALKGLKDVTAHIVIQETM